MQVEAALAITTSVLSVVGVGSFISAVRTIKKWGATEANKQRDYTDLVAAVNDIKKTLGNGAYKGIKQDIQEININCAREMADVKARVRSLEGNHEES